MTTPAQIISRAFERFTPLKLAEKWNNVGSSSVHTLIPSTSRQPRQVNPAQIRRAISTRTAAVTSYHPPIFKPLSSFTLENPLQKSLLCAAQDISVFSPPTVLDSVKGGINDWLSGTVQTAALGFVEYVGAPKEDDLGGEGRLVRFEQPVGLDSLVNVIKKVQLGRSPRPRSDGITSVAISAASGGSMLLGVDADVYFTGEMSHHEVLAAVANGRHVVLCGRTNTGRGYLPTLAEKLRPELKGTSFSGEKVEVHISTEDRHPLDIVWMPCGCPVHRANPTFSYSLVLQNHSYSPSEAPSDNAMSRPIKSSQVPRTGYT